MRYYKIRYAGKELMSIYAQSARKAKDKAKRTYQKEGRKGMNLARLEAI